MSQPTNEAMVGPKVPSMEEFLDAVKGIHGYLQPMPLEYRERALTIVRDQLNSERKPARGLVSAHRQPVHCAGCGVVFPMSMVIETEEELYWCNPCFTRTFDEDGNLEKGAQA